VGFLIFASEKRNVKTDVNIVLLQNFETFDSFLKIAKIQQNTVPWTL